MVTVRSEEKGKRILDAHPDTPKEKLSYVIVKDVAQDGAFDEVIGSKSLILILTHSTIQADSFNTGRQVEPAI